VGTCRKPSFAFDSDHGGQAKVTATVPPSLQRASKPQGFVKFSIRHSQFGIDVHAAGNDMHDVCCGVM
jgi:hypothetical protein